MQSRLRLWFPVFLSVIVGTLAISVTTASAQAPAGNTPGSDEPLYRVTSKHSRFNIVERFSKVVELNDRIKRVDGFDPETVSVTALSPNQVRVQAVKPGVTTMVLLDERGKIYQVEIFVTGDVRHLQAYISKLFPNASVEAVEVRDSVALRGWVTQPEHINEMVEIAEQFYPRVINQMRVGGVQQVMLKVKVMEVQRSKIRRIGINWVYLNQSGFLTSTPGALTPIGAITAPFGGPPGISINSSSFADPTISFGLLNDHNIFQGFVEALKSEGLLKIKAEPTLLVNNGRPATILNGGEFPILVPQSLGTVTIEWREFGVRMEAVATILGGGRVRLEISPEVSERDFTNSVESQGLIVPGLTVRRANTSMEMMFGQTLMIAGLISSRNTATTQKIPLLGDIPYIGTAFSRKQYDEVETELVIMVTPEFVAPLPFGQVPPGGPGAFTTTPTFRELVHDNMIEVPNYGEECEGCQTSDVFGPTGGSWLPGVRQGLTAPDQRIPAGQYYPPARSPAAPAPAPAAEPAPAPLPQPSAPNNPDASSNGLILPPVSQNNAMHSRQRSTSLFGRSTISDNRTTGRPTQSARNSAVNNVSYNPSQRSPQGLIEPTQGLIEP